MNKDITIAILAGGKSSRMGRDKGLISIHGKRIIDIQLAKANLLSPSVIIISNQDAYQNLGFPCYEDIFKDSGPMGGIYTALLNAPTSKVFVWGCDMPFLDELFLSLMMNTSHNEQILMPKHQGELQPLCAIYNSSITPKLEELLQSQKLSMKIALNEIPHKILDTSEIANLSNKCFMNINTPEELEGILGDR